MGPQSPSPVNLCFPIIIQKFQTFAPTVSFAVLPCLSNLASFRWPFSSPSLTLPKVKTPAFRRWVSLPKTHLAFFLPILSRPSVLLSPFRFLLLSPLQPLYSYLIPTLTSITLDVLTPNWSSKPSYQHPSVYIILSPDLGHYTTVFLSRPFCLPILSRSASLLATFRLTSLSQPSSLDLCSLDLLCFASVP